MNALYGSLIGTVMGDMFGLPYEGLSPRRAKRFFDNQRRLALIPWLNGGMVSDDSDHAIMTVQAFIASGGDPKRFGISLSRRLRLWLLQLPAGIGMATGRSIFKMYLGAGMFGRTGVFSAGNGSAMRASVLGVLCDDLEQLKQLNHISTTLTHTDPKAEQGSYLVALLAWVETRHGDWDDDKVWAWLCQEFDDKFLDLLKTYTPCPKRGITGYMYDTAPAVFWAWRTYRHAPTDGMAWLICQGGDTDTTCAIFGALSG